MTRIFFSQQNNDLHIQTAYVPRPEILDRTDIGAGKKIISASRVSRKQRVAGFKKWRVAPIKVVERKGAGRRTNLV